MRCSPDADGPVGRGAARWLSGNLNEQSGLLGVSGVSGDMRKVLTADDGNERARLAVEMFVHRVVATVGAMVAVLGGLDTLVFTGASGSTARASEPRSRPGWPISASSWTLAPTRVPNPTPK